MNNSIFCNRVLSLISETDVARLMLSFNELIVEQYAATKKTFLLMRSIRQARIRLSIAIETYEVSGRCARTVLKLLEAEEELLHDQSQDKELCDFIVDDPKMRWTATISDYTEMVYGIHAICCISGGACSLNDIHRALGSIFHVRLSLPQMYKIFAAIRGRKKEQLVFLKRMYEALKQRIEDMDR